MNRVVNFFKMRNKYFSKIRLVVLAVFLFSSMLSFSQVTYSETVSEQKGRKTKTYTTSGTQSAFHPHWQIGVGFGTALFFGDVKQNDYKPTFTDKDEIRYGGDFTLGYNFSPVFGLRGTFLYAHVAGENDVITRYFYSDILEYALNLDVNLSNIFSRYRSDRVVDFNLILGVGQAHFNSKTENWATGSVHKIGYGKGKGIDGRTIETILLAGLGLDFRLNNNMTLRLESVLRGMDTDMMDGIEGFRFKYDMYNYTSLKYIYKFGRRVKKATEVPYTSEATVVRYEPIEHEDSDKNNQAFNRVIDLSELYYTNEDQLVEEIKEEIVEKPIIIEKPVVIEEPVYEKPQNAGIEYRVQIRARQGKPIIISTLSQQYNIPAADIQQSMHNGYYIYTLGSFATYEQARQYCEVVRSRHSVHDAFVVAFENGVRLNKLP